jgi:hypothetical protein
MSLSHEVRDLHDHEPYIERRSIMPRTTLILAVTVSLLQGGCGQQPGGCNYQVESIELGGAMLDKHAGNGEKVDKDMRVWVCRNGQLVPVH